MREHIYNNILTFEPYLDYINSTEPNESEAHVSVLAFQIILLLNDSLEHNEYELLNIILSSIKPWSTDTLEFDFECWLETEEEYISLVKNPKLEYSKYRDLLNRIIHKIKTQTFKTVEELL